jgi:hypothetical protein
VRILVVEDEAKVARALKEGLESEHYQVVVAGPARTASFSPMPRPSTWWSSISCSPGGPGSKSSPRAAAVDS